MLRRYGLLLSFLVVYLGIALFPIEGLVGGPIGASNNRIYSYAIATYVALFVVIMFRFRKRVSLPLSLGYGFSSVAGAYALNELVFKLSFPLLDPSPYRFQYLFTWDLQPLIVFSLMSLSFLVTAEFWRVRSGYFLVSVLVFILSWALWWISDFPITPAALAQHEGDRRGLPLLFDAITKLTTVNLPIAILRR